LEDVIIVGAGPAGSAAANILAKNGLKVIILEKEKIPRHKNCAGGLALRCINSLYKLDINIKEVSLQDYSGFSLTYKDLTTRSDLGRTVGWGVYREDFDYLLAKKAISNGAKVIQEKVISFKEIDGRIKVFTNRGVRESTLLFGADGIGSIVSKELGVEYGADKIGYFLETEIKATKNKIEQFGNLLHLDLSYLDKGYAWAFPKINGETINVGIGCYLYLLKTLDLPLQELLKDFAKSHNISDDLKNVRGGLLPFGGTTECFGNGNVILLGDAAGLVSPVSGEGIPYALESGIIAAECAFEFFEKQVSLVKSYYEKIKSFSVDINQYGITLQNRVYGSDKHRKHVVKLCSSNNYLMDIMGKIFTHIITHEEGVRKISPIKLLVSSLSS